MARTRRVAQLELELGDLPGAGKDLPWGGRSPRGLTKASKAFSFRREGMGRLNEDASHVGDIDLETLGQRLLPLMLWR